MLGVGEFLTVVGVVDGRCAIDNLCACDGTAGLAEAWEVNEVLLDFSTDSRDSLVLDDASCVLFGGVPLVVGFPSDLVVVSVCFGTLFCFS